MIFKYKSVLQWVKNNPVAVGSAVLGLASVACLVVVQLMATSFREALLKRAAEVPTINRYMASPISVPSNNPDNPPTSTRIAINQAAIDALRDDYSQMDLQYKRIWDYAVTINRGEPGRLKHPLLLDGLFPDPGLDDDKKFAAKSIYLRAFDDMFKPYVHVEGAQLPQMDAGLPVSDTEVAAELEQVRDNFLLGFLTVKQEGDLSLADRATLEKRLREAKVGLLKRRAESIHVYAQTDAGSSNYPFQVGHWARDNNRPDMADIWEGQMELWIQQDVVAAICACNHVEDPTANEVTVPVKRLVNITVPPTYVGIDTGNGGVGPGGPAPAPSAAPASGDVALPENFAISPTGRQSNALYDVRHVSVTLVVDFQQLPKLFNALAQTNFITVLEMDDFQDKDAYAAMQEGYYYGSGDTVQVKMLLETIWLRSWTTQWMPAKVKDMLRVADSGKAAGSGN